MPSDHASKMIRATAIATLPDHGVEPAGRQLWVLLEALDDEGNVGIGKRGTDEIEALRNTVVGQHAAHDAVNQVPGPTAGLEKLASGEQASRGSGSPGVPLRALKDGQARSTPDKGGLKAADGTC